MGSRPTSISLLLGILVLSALGLSEARLRGHAASRPRHDEPHAALAAASDRLAATVAEAPSPSPSRWASSSPDGGSPCVVSAQPALDSAPPYDAGRHVCIAASTVAHPLYLRSVVLLL